MNPYQILHTPLYIGPRQVKNRFFIQAMECTDADEDGNPTELTMKRYANLFAGGAGMVTLEAISITDRNRARQNQLLIMPKNREKLTTFIKKLKEISPDTLLILQLTHSGELSSSDFSECVTVKNLSGQNARLLTEEDVDRIMDEFVLSSRIAYECGADGIDLKLCHGYLGSQILRPYNDRDWKYGGPWERRRAFAFELLERIRAEVPDPNFLVGSKISMWEAFPGGCGTTAPDSPVIDLTEMIDLIKGLEERGAQYFVESAGSAYTGKLLQPVREVPYFAYLHQSFAKIMREQLKPSTTVIGSAFSLFKNGKNNGLPNITDADSSLLAYGADCVQKGYMDMIGLGRQSLADPALPQKALNGEFDKIHYCTGCMNCLQLLKKQQPVGCVVYNRYYTDLFRSVRNQ